ncbi:MAG: DinB family protein [Deltaproteobacteria bacterium]|nr:MAG: DinB family protein [Deltaproteobacteria bacterium]
MKNIAQQLRSIIATVEPQLSRMKHNDMRVKANPHEWSKKEILGHLIDSAANNHQRFVRAVNKGATQFPSYDQDEWVRIQRYNERPWPSLVALWSAYNNHVSHVIECIPKDAESSPCNIGKEEPVPLDFVIKDYLRHLGHHLKDILGEKI